MKKFLYILIQWTWGFLQNFIGLIWYLMWCCNQNNDCHVINPPLEHQKYAKAVKWNIPYGSMSLGMFLFLDDEDETLVAHEYGHSIQSLILGPLYLFVIGIPSLCWAAFGRKYREKHNKTYYEFYTESWANKIAGLDKNRRFIKKEN